MLKTTRHEDIHPKTTDIAIPPVESIYHAIGCKVSEITEAQRDELAKAVHAKCMELKSNQPARINTSHQMEFRIQKSPTKRAMYYSMGHPSEYAIQPINCEGLPREMHFRLMTIPTANRVILHYVDKHMKEYIHI